MALADYNPTLQWYADALTDLDEPTGTTKSNPGALTDPTITGSPDAYAAFTGTEAVLFAPAAAVNNVGTGPLTIVAKIRMPTASAGEVIAENWDGSGANDSDVGWQLVRTTGTSRRIGLALPPTAYTTERIETPANATTNGQDFIVAFRRDGTTWTVWLDGDAAGGMSQQTPGTNNLPGNAGFSSCGDIAIGSTRAGASTFGNAAGGGRVYWLVAFDAAISDADLELAAWDTESNLKAAWLGGGGIAGTLSTSIGSITLSSSAALAIVGSLAQSVGAITLASASTLTITGTASVSIGTIALASTGALSLVGALSGSIGNITLSAQGSSGTTGTLAQSIGAITLSAAGQLPIAGALSASIGTIGLAATAQLPIVATLAATIGPITLSATGTAVSGGTGQLSQSIGQISISASAQLRLTGQLAQTLGDITILAQGLGAQTGTLSQTLGAITLSALGALSLRAQLSQTIGNLTLSAHGGDAVPPGAAIRTITVRAVDRTITVRGTDRTIQ